MQKYRVTRLRLTAGQTTHSNIACFWFSLVSAAGVLQRILVMRIWALWLKADLHLATKLRRINLKSWSASRSQKTWISKRIAKERPDQTSYYQISRLRSKQVVLFSSFTFNLECYCTSEVLKGLSRISSGNYWTPEDVTRQRYRYRGQNTMKAPPLAYGGEYQGDIPRTLATREAADG